MRTIDNRGPANASNSIMFVGNNPKVLHLLDTVSQIAYSNATVLICGESGTGKEIIARLIHSQSARSRQPFIAVNCGAITETIQESELFGHVKGAFTGALARKLGKFEAADTGTIFLDEIEEMSKVLQVKLLRILQTGEYSPVGMAVNRNTDVRVVAATNRDLQSLVNEGRFREDFYYRLNIIRLDLPALRERKDDIGVLAEYFLERFKSVYGKPRIRFSTEGLRLLLQYRYPGNVRELENMIHRAVILCRDNVIAPEFLPPEVRHNTPADASPFSEDFHNAKAEAVGHFERMYLTSVLQKCGGIISRAAHLSGLSERNFHEKLKKYKIHGKAFRSGIS